MSDSSDTALSNFLFQGIMKRPATAACVPTWTWMTSSPSIADCLHTLDLGFRDAQRIASRCCADPGSLNISISASSINLPSEPYNVRSFGLVPLSSDLVISSTAVIAFEPDNLTTDIPALPGADASAKMVSKRQLLVV